MKTSLTIVILFSVVSFAHSQKIRSSVKIKDVDGNSVELDSVVAQHSATVLFFWALWAAKERSPLYNVNEVYDDWKKNYNAEFLAVSMDDSRNTTKIKGFTDGTRLNFPILLDANSDLKRVFNFQSIPYCIIINQQGEIVYRKNGYLQGDEFEWEDELKNILEQKQK
ncbi:MAG: TlpA disulfide reductase family protein [Chitinophagales bacterium]